MKYITSKEELEKVLNSMEIDINPIKIEKDLRKFVNLDKKIEPYQKLVAPKGRGRVNSVDIGHLCCNYSFAYGIALSKKNIAVEEVLNISLVGKDKEVRHVYLRFPSSEFEKKRDREKELLFDPTAGQVISGPAFVGTRLELFDYLKEAVKNSYDSVVNKTEPKEPHFIGKSIDYVVLRCKGEMYDHIFSGGDASEDEIESGVTSLIANLYGLNAVPDAYRRLFEELPDYLKNFKEESRSAKDGFVVYDDKGEGVQTTFVDKSTTCHIL